jgi:hypothetical protein
MRFKLLMDGEEMVIAIFVMTSEKPFDSSERGS